MVTVAGSVRSACWRSTAAFAFASALAALTDAKGQITSHTYDGRGEETLRLFADQTRVTNSYDAAGRLVQTVDPLGTWTHGYDAVGRAQTIFGPSYPANVGVNLTAQPFTSVYDPNGNRIQLRTAWGTRTYTYDARDQLTSLTDPGLPGWPESFLAGIYAGVTTWSYDARQHQARVDYSNGALSTATYDALGRPLQIRYSKADGTELERAFYVYDAHGRPLTKDTLTARFTYGYDAIDQLRSEYNLTGLSTWTYDAAYRRVSQQTPTTLTNYTYDAADQLLLAAPSAGQPTTYLYDPNGSLLQSNAGGLLTTYAWDAANRLFVGAIPNGNRFTCLYRQDGEYDGLRALRLSGTPLQADLATTFVWDGPDLFAQVLRRFNTGGVGTYERGSEIYVHGGPGAAGFGPRPGPGSELIKAFIGDEIASGTILLADSHEYVDAQGAVQAYGGQASGPSSHVPTDAWGNQIGGGSRSGEEVYLGPLGYFYDTYANLYYVRARWLDPTTGRWISVDPVESEPRYGYVHNSPTLLTDPSGEQSQRSTYGPGYGRFLVPGVGGVPPAKQGRQSFQQLARMLPMPHHQVRQWTREDYYRAAAFFKLHPERLTAATSDEPAGSMADAFVGFGDSFLNISDYARNFLYWLFDLRRPATESDIEDPRVMSSPR